MKSVVSMNHTHHNPEGVERKLFIEEFFSKSLLADTIVFFQQAEVLNKIYEIIFRHARLKV